MLKNEVGKQIYCFGMLVVVVIVALDRMNSQTVLAQTISGSLVALTIFAYVTGIYHSSWRE